MSGYDVMDELAETTTASASGGAAGGAGGPDVPVAPGFSDYDTFDELALQGSVDTAYDMMVELAGGDAGPQEAITEDPMAPAEANAGRYAYAPEGELAEDGAGVASADEGASTEPTPAELNATARHTPAPVQDASGTPLPSEGTDWNEQFQIILDDPAVLARHVAERTTSIDTLCSKFVSAARPVVETIVRESHLDANSRTYPPLDVGGVAGGVKFSVKKQFIKFAFDEHGLFGSDFFAAKGAGLELNALNQLVATVEPGLHFPLMATIDYAGRRLSVSSELPITGSSSLCYGSADAGRTVYGLSDIPDAVARTAVINSAQKLNLKEHIVNGKVVQFAGDVEGHMSKADARFYLLDLQRCLPPEMPKMFTYGVHVPVDTSAAAVPVKAISDASAGGAASHAAAWSAVLEACTAGLGVASVKSMAVFGRRAFIVVPDPATWTAETPVNKRLTAIASGLVVKGPGIVVVCYGMRSEVLYELLRPEFVASNPVPLSSDCFTRWGVDDAKTHNGEVREATRRLHTEVIPLLASRLETSDPLDFSTDETKTSFHASGVNLRHLGFVRKHIKRPEWRALLLCEMVARAFRRRLKNDWATLKELSDIALARKAVAQLNVLLGHHAISSFYWNIDVKLAILTQFRDALTEEEVSFQYDLRQSIPSAAKKAMFVTALQLTGIKLACTEEECFARPLRIGDIDSVVSIVKKIQVPEAELMDVADLQALKRSIEKYEHQVAERIAAFGEYHPAVVSSLENLAKVCWVQKEHYPQAIESSKRALEIVGHRFGKDSEEYLIQEFQMLVRFVLRVPGLTLVKDAEDLHARTLAKFGEDHMQSVLTHELIARALSDGEQSLRAAEIYQACIKKLRTFPGDNRLRIAESLSSLGLHLGALNMVVEQEAALKQAVDIMATFGSDMGPAVDSAHGQALGNLALVYMSTNRNDLALSYFNQAAETYERTLGKNTVTYATLMINKAMLLSRIGDNEGAIRLNTEAISLLDLVTDKETKLYATAINNMGTFYGNLQQWSNSLVYLNQAFEIRQRVLGPRSVSTMEVMMSMGGVYNWMSDCGNATMCFKRCLPVFREKLPPGDVRTMRCGQQLMQCQMVLQQTYGMRYNQLQTAAMQAQQAGDLEGSIRYFNQVLEFHPSDESTHYNLACLFCVRKDIDRSLAELALAAEFGFAHPDHVREDPDLEPLRSHASFASSLTKITENAMLQAEQVRQARAAQQQAAGTNPLMAMLSQSSAASSNPLEALAALMRGGAQPSAGAGTPVAVGASGMTVATPSAPGFDAATASLAQQPAQLPSAHNPTPTISIDARGDVESIRRQIAGLPLSDEQKEAILSQALAAKAQAAAARSGATSPAAATAAAAATSPAAAPAASGLTSSAPTTTSTPASAATPAAAAVAPPVAPTSAAVVAGAGGDFAVVLASVSRVVVGGTSRVEGQGKPFTLYELVVHTQREDGVPTDPYIINRRYREVKRLYSTMNALAKAQGMGLPPFPKGGVGRFFSRNKPKQVEARRKAFQALFDAVMNSESLRNNPVLKDFLRE